MAYEFTYLCIYHLWLYLMKPSKMNLRSYWLNFQNSMIKNLRLLFMACNISFQQVITQFFFFQIRFSFQKNRFHLKFRNVTFATSWKKSFILLNWSLLRNWKNLEDWTSSIWQHIIVTWTFWRCFSNMILGISMLKHQMQLSTQEH